MENRLEDVIVTKKTIKHGSFRLGSGLNDVRIMVEPITPNVVLMIGGICMEPYMMRQYAEALNVLADLVDGRA